MQHRGGFWSYRSFMVTPVCVRLSKGPTEGPKRGSNSLSVDTGLAVGIKMATHPLPSCGLQRGVESKWLHNTYYLVAHKVVMSQNGYINPAVSKVGRIKKNSNIRHRRANILFVVKASNPFLFSAKAWSHFSVLTDNIFSSVGLHYSTKNCTSCTIHKAFANCCQRRAKAFF